MPVIYVSLGANLGQRFATIKGAFEALKNIPATSGWHISSVYESVPEHGEGPDFLNAVAMGETELEPTRLLEYLLALETEFGRRKHADRSRELDLDLIDYGGITLESETPNLILPHPRAHTRWFVLKPLCDLNPDWLHPTLDKTAHQLLSELPEGGRKYDENIN